MSITNWNFEIRDLMERSYGGNFTSELDGDDIAGAKLAVPSMPDSALLAWAHFPTGCPLFGPMVRATLVQRPYATKSYSVLDYISLATTRNFVMMRANILASHKNPEPRDKNDIFQESTIPMEQDWTILGYDHDASYLFLTPEDKLLLESPFGPVIELPATLTETLDAMAALIRSGRMQPIAASSKTYATIELDSGWRFDPELCEWYRLKPQ